MDMELDRRIIIALLMDITVIIITIINKINIIYRIKVFIQLLKYGVLHYGDINLLCIEYIHKDNAEE